MATQVSVLFGEVITDNAIQRTVPSPAGVYEMGTPTISGSGPWTASINPGGDRNVVLWREVGSSAQGRATIKEDSAITFTIAAASGQPRIDLLIGCHQWVDGSAIPACMTSGSPNGYMDASMYPYYRVVQGTPAASPVPPTLAASYTGGSGNGGAPVILGYVYVPASGSPTIGAWDPLAAKTFGVYPPTDLRWSTLYGFLEEIVAAREGYSSLLLALQNISLTPGPKGDTGSAAVGLYGRTFAALNTGGANPTVENVLGPTGSPTATVHACPRALNTYTQTEALVIQTAGDYEVSGYVSAMTSGGSSVPVVLWKNDAILATHGSGNDITVIDPIILTLAVNDTLHLGGNQSGYYYPPASFVLNIKKVS